MGVTLAEDGNVAPGTPRLTEVSGAAGRTSRAPAAPDVGGPPRSEAGRTPYPRPT
ncbi:hypothetical protein [Streptomyces alkaliterrae]|uniref:Uncharacterized protein n=1 Tax=Streptomyces alkaliterrae TaxID=2213162 RepID=A0A7W3ZT29_9ACTN|nr:hypothetical protein [Streptomyces alkaliterrae]MBB1259377.1 hypothetical protein [Streptomyces alkaliterrae]